MDTTDAIGKLKDRIGLVRRTLDYHKRRIIALEGEALRLSIALGVMEEIESDKTEIQGAGIDDLLVASDDFQALEAADETADRLSDPDDSESVDASPGNVGTVSMRMMPFETNVGDRPTTTLAPPTKHLIRMLFDGDQVLTREEVISAIESQGHKVNPGTVATTLSKLVGERVLKRDGNGYVRANEKDADDDTNDGDDLI